MQIAIETENESLEATKDIMRQHGKAAVYHQKTIGLVGPRTSTATVLTEFFTRAYLKEWISIFIPYCSYIDKINSPRSTQSIGPFKLVEINVMITLKVYLFAKLHKHSTLFQS